MLNKKRIHPEEKSILHPRNIHRKRYDFKALGIACPELKPFIAVNAYGDESVDFSNPDAVKYLNKALLSHFYGLRFWDIPPGHLCPPVPGRADYMHYAADLLAESNNGNIPHGSSVRVLDIGTGANAIYPIIGHAAYGWNFTGTDIDPVSVKSANAIATENPGLSGHIECLLQRNKNHIFKGIIQSGETYDLTVCNPPFYASANEAEMHFSRKAKNLKLVGKKGLVKNFGGTHNELWTEGGELRFIESMVQESKLFANNCLWFTSLVSKQSHMNTILRFIQNASACQVKTIPMGQGQKNSRMVAWTFMEKGRHRDWFKYKPVNG